MTSQRPASGLLPQAPASRPAWAPGDTPIAMVMISLNEAHNMAAVLDNLAGFAQEVFLVDSYSSDRTVDLALERGVHVVQRRFRGFGDQWNYAMMALPVTAPWTMKLDPDERLTDDLKQSIRRILAAGEAEAFTVRRRLWFMGQPLPATQVILRGWRTGTCRFSDVLVNEHPLVTARTVAADGILEHHDSPDLHHWTDKQNRYSTAEAISAFRGLKLSATPRLFGTALERRMWLKRNFHRLPFRYTILHAYNLFATGAWRAGAVGRVWARLRVQVHLARELKLMDMTLSGKIYELPEPPVGQPHPGAVQADDTEPAPQPGASAARSRD